MCDVVYVIYSRLTGHMQTFCITVFRIYMFFSKLVLIRQFSNVAKMRIRMQFALFRTVSFVSVDGLCNF